MNAIIKLKGFLDSKGMILSDYILALSAIAYGSYTWDILFLVAGWLGLALATYRPSRIADHLVAKVVKKPRAI
ncbi:hypothetical protein [Vibrio metschnikovii]|uniref:Uncharacterized protein n=1 Tax=Vibrio metschnikovii TaxID=28172 RepID=A0A9X0RBW3_VIBME|nr:hypothetical protein [Vibrio metschnikovii]MBC5852010.1 hypothetical protein [Vibrio metschnikovii]